MDILVIDSGNIHFQSDGGWSGGCGGTEKGRQAVGCQREADEGRKPRASCQFPETGGGRRSDENTTGRLETGLCLGMLL